MKFFTSVNSLNPKRILALTAIFAGTLLMQSCGKDETPVIEASSITVITAVPSLGTNNVYLGSKLLNSAPLPFAERIPYTQIPAGTQNVKFTTANSTASLISKDLQFANNTMYTLILTGRPNNLEFL